MIQCKDLKYERYTTEQLKAAVEPQIKADRKSVV